MKKIFSNMGLERYVVDIKDYKLFGGICEFPRPDSESGQLIVSSAEDFLKEEIPQLHATAYMRFAHDGNRSEYEDGFFQKRWRLLTFLAAECIEKKADLLRL